MPTAIIMNGKHALSRLNRDLASVRALSCSSATSSKHREGKAARNYFRAAAIFCAWIKCDSSMSRCRRINDLLARTDL